MILPSFEPVPKSPAVADLGLAASLEAAAVKVGQPAILYGTYRVDGEFIRKCHDEPHTWILLVAIRRDRPAVWSKAVREKPNLSPIPPSDNDERFAPSFRREGYFNLDLRRHLGLPDEPGRYWLIVSMGDYSTEKISFEIHQ